LSRAALDLQGWHQLRAARRLQGLSGEDSASTIPATLLGRAAEVIE
jgi:hypothetical protein